MGFVRYYGTVLCMAFTHALGIAQSVIFALAISVGGVAYFIPKTQAILSPWITALSGWQVATGVLGTIVFVRLALAPYWIFKQQSQQIDDLKQSVAIPDLEIDTRRAPEIFTNPKDDEIVHIIIRDLYITNRSNFAASIELRLKFNVGFTMSPNQDDSPPDLVETLKGKDPSIGRHLGKMISLSARKGVTGYLSYRVSDRYTRSLAEARSMNTEELLNDLEKTLEIQDHISGITRSISFRTLGPYSFRDLES
jgi:hypothetical protein